MSVFVRVYYVILFFLAVISVFLSVRVTNTSLQE